MSGALPPPGPPPQAGPPPGPPGMPPQPMQPPMPQLVPNPAFALWQKQQQEVQAIQAENAKEQAQFDAAYALLKKDGLHGFRLDIETDSTIEPDQEAEKASRMEFMGQIIPMLENVIPLAMGNPAIAKLVKELTLFGVRSFPVARPVEDAVEEAFDAIAGMPPMPPKGAKAPAPGKDPAIEQAKIAADVHDTQVKAQAQVATSAAKTQSDTQVAQLKAQTDQQTIAQKQQQAEMEAQQHAAQMEATAHENQQKMGLEMAKMDQHERLENVKIDAAASKAASHLE